MGYPLARLSVVFTLLIFATVSIYAAEIEQQDLKVSPNGKYLTSPKGEKLYRYYKPVDGYVPLSLHKKFGKKIDVFRKTAGTGDIKWHCYDVCVLYDENHVCIQKQRTCDPIIEPIDF